MPPRATPRTRFTIQVAAYDTRPAAERLAARLTQRGILARVVGDSRPPFRVRVGVYASERDASDAARALKSKGITGFVTSAEAESTRSPR